MKSTISRVWDGTAPRKPEDLIDLFMAERYDSLGFISPLNAEWPLEIDDNTTLAANRFFMSFSADYRCGNYDPTIENRRQSCYCPQLRNTDLIET